MLKLFAAERFEITADAVARSDFNVITQLKDGVVTVVYLDNEHTPSQIHRNNRSFLHGIPCSNFPPYVCASLGFRDRTDPRNFVELAWIRFSRIRFRFGLGAEFDHFRVADQGRVQFLAVLVGNSLAFNPELAPLICHTLVSVVNLEKRFSHRCFLRV
ncbi:hypothetical protein [Burkholderia vietnamiensis]|uniref:hypothetical protein n=1 Tax=Burkholderia vietnamiensis TaxID=60552 RepID=UPI0012DA87E2|nr:hypothetical protein [Burkholderia vietnamiensis]MCA8073941.1 hypothetical protein [Burkholderia vietnamiensis]